MAQKESKLAGHHADVHMPNVGYSKATYTIPHFSVFENMLVNNVKPPVWTEIWIMI